MGMNGVNINGIIGNIFEIYWDINPKNLMSGFVSGVYIPPNDHEKNMENYDHDFGEVPNFRQSHL